jgi:hypothetical protein
MYVLGVIRDGYTTEAKGHEPLNIHTFTTSAPLTNSIREQFKLTAYLLRHGPIEMKATGDAGEKKDGAD